MPSIVATSEKPQRMSFSDAPHFYLRAAAKAARSDRALPVAEEAGEECRRALCVSAEYIFGSFPTSVFWHGGRQVGAGLRAQ